MRKFSITVACGISILYQNYWLFPFLCTVQFQKETGILTILNLLFNMEIKIKILLWEDIAKVHTAVQAFENTMGVKFVFGTSIIYNHFKALSTT